MIRLCATPGCGTLTFGEICLRCLQRRARAQHARAEDEGKSAPDEELAADAPR